MTYVKYQYEQQKLQDRRLDQISYKNYLMKEGKQVLCSVCKKPLTKEHKCIYCDYD